MLRNGKPNIIEDLEEQFNENIYLILVDSAQEKPIQRGIENRVDELLEVDQGSHALFDSIVFEDETLIITNINIIEFKYRNNALKKCGRIEIKI
jgi:hypothetical protein